MKCPNCGSDNPSNTKFCGECGAPLSLVCAVCGKSNPAHHKFCSECGSALSARGPMVQPGGAASARAPPEAEAERRQLTVMFCDVVGSTALSVGMDPEDLRQIMAGYHACVTEAVGRHGGTVARYMGDGVLAYFGYPKAHEDDAEQAIRAGLAIIEAVAALHASPGRALQTRVGIASGMVVVGDLIGKGGAQEQAAFGETPNLAAHLQGVAEPGTIIVCPSTHGLTEGYFDFREMDPVKVKGLPEPITVWRVLGASGIESRFEARHKTRLIPLVGREEEIELLMRRWRRVTQGEGRVVLLTGEPGIGKSHIALAFEERLQSEPHVSIRHFYSAHHTNSALFPIINHLERAARFERSDNASAKLAKLRALLANSIPDADETVELFAHLMALPTDGRHRVSELSAPKRKEKTFSALLTQMEAISSRRPLLILYEDVHWIDPTSLELLTLTIERIPRTRTLLLVTARPDFVPPWPRHAHVTTISLPRLDRSEGAELIDRVTAGRALPQSVIDAILTRTDGVPLFVEELTKAMLESGLLSEQNGRYVLTGPLPTLAIPKTLQASLLARLDRLSSPRELAQIGSAIGREFSYELLGAVAKMPVDQLKDGLNQLTRSELVFQRGEIPDAVFTFKHALVRDAAYSGLLREKRTHLHATIANTLEQGFPDIAESQPETVARHFTEGGLIEKAAPFWLRAGKNAAKRSANLEAIAQLQRGIDVIERLPDGAAKDRLELDLQVCLGPCLIATQGPASSKAVATFARARELCERLSDPPEYLQVLFWIATASVIRGELPQAREATATVLGLAQARGDRPALLNALRGLGMILLFMGCPAEARDFTGRAVEAFCASSEAERLAAQAAGQDAGAAGLALMSWALWLLGHVDEAAAKMSAALERADAVQHPHTQAYVAYYASILHALRGETAIARRYAERCFTLSEQHEFRHWRGLSQAIRGVCVSLLDGSADALDEVKRALEEYRAGGYQLGTTALHALLCSALLLRGEAEPAFEMIEHGLATCERNGERIFEAELYRLKAQTALVRGAPDSRAQAQSLLDKALNVARSQQARSLELRAATDLAALWSAQGKCDEAIECLTPIFASFTQGSKTPDVRQARELMERLH